MSLQGKAFYNLNSVETIFYKLLHNSFKYKLLLN